jgi:hypothetical protein
VKPVTTRALGAIFPDAPGPLQPAECALCFTAMKRTTSLGLLVIGLIAAAVATGCADNNAPPAASPSGGQGSDSDGGAAAPAQAPAQAPRGGW